MKALVKFGKGREGMEIREVPVPEPGEGEVLLRIKAAGICGSDIHAMNDERKVALPLILGHEFVGEVAKLCGDCGDIKEGDWVTGIPAAYNCGKCIYCRKGEVTICPEHESVGVMRNGGMAEYMVYPAAYCLKVSEDLTEDEKLSYAAAEPLACVVRGVYERITVRPGDVAVVSGPGTIGLFAVQALKSRGAYVIVSGLPADRHRLDKALELGADKTAESFEELMAAVYEKNPEGADVVCETAGAAPSFAACIKAVKIHGTILQLGMYGGDVKCDLNAVFAKELFIAGSNSTATTTWETTMQLLNSKRVNLTPVISLKLPLSEWEKGFDATIDKTAFKVLLLP